MVEQDGKGAAEAESEGIDLEHLREIVGFSLRAARRRLKLTIFTFVAIATVGVGVAKTMPRLYVAEVKLLAQRSSAMRALSSPNPVLDAADSPTKNAAAMILRRDNLAALAKETDLVDRFEATRPRALQFKDRVMARLFGAPSYEDKMTGLVFTLESQVTVEVLTDDATVVISVEWQNPKIAYDLVTLIQKHFTEARYDSDVAMINDSITVLEEHAKNELARVDQELEAYRKLATERAIQEKARKAAATTAASPSAPRTFVGIARRQEGAAATTPASGGERDLDLAKALEDKRAQIRVAEDAHQRMLENLKQQLAQAQLTLTPMHPTVIALQQKVDAVSAGPPELVALKSEERALMAELVPPKAAAVGSASSPTPMAIYLPAPRGSSDAEAPADLLPLPQSVEDGALMLAQSKLGAAIRAYEDAMGRIDAAKVELDITSSAYKHRYTVVTPATEPRKPKKATAQSVAIGSVFGGFVFALLLASGLDLATGRILEAWQIRRRLKLDVLADFDNPS